MKEGQQDAYFGDAGGVVFAVGTNHGETERAEVEEADGGLIGGHAEFGAEIRVNSFEARLKCGVGGGCEGKGIVGPGRGVGLSRHSGRCGKEGFGKEQKED